MAPSIVINDAVQGETFLPRQIFVFGGFALRANSLGHLEQIDSYAPGHQIMFGNLNYTADVRGDLIFDGFEPAPGAPDSHDEHGLDLLSNGARCIIPEAALDLNPGQVPLPMDGGLDPAPQAAHLSAVEPNVGLTSMETYNPGPPDSYPAVGPGPLTLEPASRARLGSSNGVYRCGHLSALSFWRHAELIKVSLFFRRLWAELCPA